MSDDVAPVVPDRWMHLRRPGGFSDRHFDIFRASAGVLAAYAAAFLREASTLIGEGHPPLEYTFFPAEISPDRRMMTLPIGGARTLGSRAYIENAASYLLWQRLPHQILGELEEGITESLGTDSPPEASWRTLSHFLFLRPEAIDILRSRGSGPV
jgi:hypothetical protein